MKSIVKTQMPSRADTSTEDTANLIATSKIKSTKNGVVKAEITPTEAIQTEAIQTEVIQTEAIQTQPEKPEKPEKIELSKSASKLPPEAQKKMQGWIRSRHLICSGHFYIFETVDYSAIERFTNCIESLGGTLISVAPIGKMWMGDHRQVVLYRAKASLHTPCHQLKQYWIKYGSFRTRFDEQV